VPFRSQTGSWAQRGALHGGIAERDASVTTVEKTQIKRIRCAASEFAVTRLCLFLKFCLLLPRSPGFPKRLRRAG
jgi:hypothetical protein